MIFWPFVKKYFKEGEAFSVLIDNTFSITSIESSTKASNQMSDLAYAILDCRLLPGTNTEQFIKDIKRTVGNKISVTTLLQSPSAPPTPITPFFEDFANAIKTVHPTAEIIPILFPATTDNNYFRNLNIPVYGIIPSILNANLFETVHSHNERIGVNNLYKGIDVFYYFLRKTTFKVP
jgi:carboxypeptidase PM20D1